MQKKVCEKLKVLYIFEFLHFVSLGVTFLEVTIEGSTQRNPGPDGLESKIYNLKT